MRPVTAVAVDGRQPKRLAQCFACLSASFGGFCHGTVLGFASPASFQFRHSFQGFPTATADLTHPLGHTHPDFPVTGHRSSNNSMGLGAMNPVFARTTFSIHELSLFSASYCLGALIGSIVTIPLLRHLGRKTTLLLSVLPALAGWLMIGFSANFAMVVIGRLLTSVFAGITSIACSTFIGEVASSDIRGMLAGTYEMMVNFGTIYCFGIGAITTWANLAFISMAPFVLFALLMFFNKETPAYLLSNGRDEEARATLRYLRGCDYDITEEYHSTRQFQLEMKLNKISMREIQQPYVFRPFFIVLTLFCMKQLTGQLVITFNIVNIFQTTGTGLTPSTSSSICTAIELLAAFSFVFLVDVVGRKNFLIVTSIVMSLSISSLGAYFYVLSTNEAWTKSTLFWLPLAALCMYRVGYTMGVGAVGWILLGEMFPPNVREVASSICLVVNWLSVFLVTYSFESLKLAVHSYGVFWIYGGCCAVTSLFAAVFIRETKGKTLEQISAMFQRPKGHMSSLIQGDGHDVSYGSVSK